MAEITKIYGQPVAEAERYIRYSFKAGEDLHAGDYCRLQSDGTVRLIRDGEGLKAGDYVPIQNVAAGEMGTFLRFE